MTTEAGGSAHGGMTLFTNGQVLDPRWDSPRGGMEVLSGAG